MTVYEHPAFPQPVDTNAKIWRYMDFGKFVSLAETKRLYMRRADLFLGDEFEGTTPAGEIERWRQLAASAATPEDRAAIEYNRAELSGYAKHFRQNYFVSCWNMADAENVAMWERYAPQPESVCLVSRYSTLGRLLNHEVVNYGMVRYIDYQTDQLPSMNMLQLISHKRHFYRDETEVRAVMLAIAPEPIVSEHIAPFMMPDGCGWAPPIDVFALVEGVVLHPKATPDFAILVAEFCAAHLLPAPVSSQMSAKPVF
ncbi:MAG: hypothetical protein EKK33_02035 [Bradyrhizobiaceae bacterium]|nr:MAG: hypothetical protein EKK33_02035 [Bradyrhizobiaceae bacterium]